MPKLLVLKGLPASGKSTYAKELVNKGWKRVNKDDLRAMIDDRNRVVDMWRSLGINTLQVDYGNF